MNSGSPFTEYVGVQISEASGGVCKATLAHRSDLDNLNGAVHGGATCTLADVAIGWAVRSTLAPDQWCGTIELKINYINPARNDMMCTAKVVHRGKSMAVGEADVVDTGTGKLVAKALATFVIRSRGESGAASQ